MQEGREGGREGGREKEAERPGPAQEKQAFETQTTGEVKYYQHTQPKTGRGKDKTRQDSTVQYTVQYSTVQYPRCDW